MSVTTIGIVGGGQLGRMLTLAAKPLGFEVVVVDPSDVAPAAQVGAKQIKADFYDPKAIRQLAEQCDVITIESEHINVDELAAIEQLGKPIHPTPEAVRKIQDKFIQKQFLNQAGVPMAEFQELTDEPSALGALKKFKKLLIKTRKGGFDGRGNALVRNQAEARAAFNKFAGADVYAEQFVPFTRELAVMAARSRGGDIVLYPVVETKHARNICLEVHAPASISQTALQRARSLAHKVVKSFNGAGMYGIEMFLTADDQVLLNEIAPRVHNSGHYTTEGAATSQFEQHIRAVAGLPLGKTHLIHPAAVMINILGERDGPTEVLGLEQALAVPHVSIHLYGKSPTKIDRKMGHITAVGDTIQQARTRAHQARKRLSI